MILLKQSTIEPFLNCPHQRFDPALGPNARLRWQQEVRLKSMAQKSLRAKPVKSLSYCNGSKTSICLPKGGKAGRAKEFLTRSDPLRDGGSKKMQKIANLL